MDKNLTIVGNALLNTDMSKFVDYSSFVVRFNTVPHYGFKTGRKLDALCIINAGSSAEGIVANRRFQELNIPSLTDELWFSHPRADYTIEDKIISSNGLEGKTIHFPDTAMYSNLENRISFLSNKRVKSIPSSGLVALQMCLESDRFKDYTIHLVGFTFQGWQGHNWKGEKLLVEHYESCKKIKIHVV